LKRYDVDEIPKLSAARRIQFNKALEPTAAQPVELRARAGGRRRLNARALDAAVPHAG
jgi:hypothetical protein